MVADPAVVLPTAGAGAPASPPAAPAGGAPVVTAPATPAAGGAPATPAAAPATPAPSVGAPEKYAPFTGHGGSPFDAKVGAAWGEIAREQGWSQDVAQKNLGRLLSVVAERSKAAGEERAKADREAVLTEWEKEARAHPQLGGENFDKNRGMSKEGFTRLGSPALLEYFERSGLGSHPEILALGLAIYQNTGGDKYVPGNTNAPKEQSAGSVLYPSMRGKGKGA